MDKYYIVDGENMFLNFHGQIIEFDTAESAFDFLKSLPDYEKIYYFIFCGLLCQYYLGSKRKYYY